MAKSYKRMRMIDEDEYRRLREKQLIQYEPHLRAASTTFDAILGLLDEPTPASSVEDKMANLEKKQARLRQLLGDAKMRALPTATALIAPGPAVAEAPAGFNAAAVPPGARAGPSAATAEADTRAVPDAEVSDAAEDVGAPAVSAEMKEKKRIAAQIANSLPLKMKKRAQTVLDRLIDNSQVTFDTRRNLVIDGKPLKGSNIHDLVGAMFHKRGASPPRLNEFATALASINLPRSLPSRQDFIARMSPLAASTFMQTPDPSHSSASRSQTHLPSPSVASTPLAPKKIGRGAPRRVTYAAAARLLHAPKVLKLYQ